MLHSDLPKLDFRWRQNPTDGKRLSYENRIALNQIDDSRSIFIRGGELKIHHLLCQNSRYCIGILLVLFRVMRVDRFSRTV